MSDKTEYAERRRAELIEKEAQKGGFRGRVNAKCVDCIYDPLGGGSWRQQVEECTSLACPLYPVRPRSKSPRETK